jgi:hypothetical protein
MSNSGATGEGKMAYEHILKMLLGGLENTASDFERLATLLNLRISLRGRGKLFAPAECVRPKPPYPAKEESVSRVATHARTIADGYASAAKYFGAEPSSPELLDTDELGESGLLHLVAVWQELRGSALKAILRTYGESASGQPLASLPGPASERRLWAEIAAWFEKLAKDASSFTSLQRLPSARDVDSTSKGKPALLESLAGLEQSVHRATLDALLIAGLLPYHLYRTARGARPTVITRAPTS